MRVLKPWLKVCLAVVLIGGVASGAAAQDANLPSAPDAVRGSVRGLVKDLSGGLVAGAHLSLVSASGGTLTATSAADGSYVFTNVPPGTFTLTVAADSLETATMTGAVTPNGRTELAPFMLRVATLNTQVTAMTQQEMAELQIKEEEQQRLLAVIPNFFVTYNPNAVPLTSKQKFKLSGRTVIDPVIFGTTAIGAAINHATEGTDGFGPGAQGYFKWYGVTYANAFTGIMLSGAVLPSVFHQDPRYFYKGTGSVKSRLWYVTERAVTQKGDNGKWQFGYSNLLSDVSSAAITEAWLPLQNKEWGKTIGLSFGLSIASEFAGDLLQEFVFSRATTHGPKSRGARSQKKSKDGTADPSAP